MSPLIAPIRPGRRCLLALAVLPLLPRRAAAHAVVVTSDPAAGAMLAAPPRRVTLRFNSRIDQARSRLVLIGPEGALVPMEVAPGGEATLLEAALDPAAVLPPGAWRLRWQVLAVDGHITRGDVPFTLQPR